MLRGRLQGCQLEERTSSIGRHRWQAHPGLPSIPAGLTRVCAQQHSAHSSRHNSRHSIAALIRQHHRPSAVAQGQATAAGDSCVVLPQTLTDRQYNTAVASARHLYVGKHAVVVGAGPCGELTVDTRNSPRCMWLPLKPSPIGSPTPYISAPKALVCLECARAFLPR